MKSLVYFLSIWGTLKTQACEIFSKLVLFWQACTDHHYHFSPFQIKYVSGHKTGIFQPVINSLGLILQRPYSLTQITQNSLTLSVPCLFSCLFLAVPIHL